MPPVALAFTIGTPLVVLGWLWLAERIVAQLPRRLHGGVRAALWLLPAGAFIAVFLLWPLVYTVVLSLRDAAGRGWSGLSNYRFLADDDGVRSALRNNVLWVVGLVVVPTSSDWRSPCSPTASATSPPPRPSSSLRSPSPSSPGRSSGGRCSPTSRLGSRRRAPSTPCIDVLGGEPIAWLINTRVNNAALITVGVWMTAGFATIVLSAALKGLPSELIEAAQVDGASRWQAFRHITLPQLRPALVVVTTALAITALKAFDVVYVMTNGAFDTNVIANVLYQQLFVARHQGRASAVAILLTLIAAPIIYVNVRTTPRRKPAPLMSRRDEARHARSPRRWC